MAAIFNLVDYLNLVTYAMSSLQVASHVFVYCNLQKSLFPLMRFDSSDLDLFKKLHPLFKITSIESTSTSIFRIVLLKTTMSFVFLTSLSSCPGLNFWDEGNSIHMHDQNF